MQFLPLHPDDIDDSTPASPDHHDAVHAPERRTLGRRGMPSRRTLGRRGAPSRRTFGWRGKP